MNIVKHELQAHLKPLVAWSIGMILLVYIGMMKYAGFAGVGEDANQLLEQLPPAIKSILGIGELDITSLVGFYALFYLYFMLLAGLHAVMLGAEIISREEQDKTADFLFVKPLTRSRIISSKLIGLLINIIILNLVILGSSLLLVDNFSKGPGITDIIIRLMLALLVLQLVFASLGTLSAALNRNPKKASSLAAGLLMITFFISVAIDMYEEINFLFFLSPFKYFPAQELILTGRYDPFSLIFSWVIIFFSILMTYLLIEKRDLQS